MNLSPVPVQKFFDNNGAPLVNGQLFTYGAGTAIKVATYIDSTGSPSNTNPIRLDFRGECRLWIDPTLAYKFVLAPATDTDPPTNPFWSVDNITAGPVGFDNAAVDTGSVNAIALAIPLITAPVLFTRIVFQASHTNTGPTTISINGGTAKRLLWQNFGELGGGEIQTSGIYQAIYDGAQWQLEGPTLDPPQLRTAAEIAASVTPISYAYLPGNILRYGAIGNNVTNDAPAFQAAFNQAAQQGGAPVFFPNPPVCWLLDTQVNVTGSRPVKFTGAGWGYTPGGSPRGCMIRVGSGAGASAAGFDFATVEQGVQCEGFGMILSATANSNRGMRFKEILQLTMQSVRFEGASTAADTCTAIEFLDPGVGHYNGAIDIESCYITNVQKGIVIKGNSTTISIRNTEMYGNNAGFTSLIGVQIDAGNVSLTLDNVRFQGWDKAIVDAGVGTLVEGGYFEGNNVAAIDGTNAQQPTWVFNRLISGGGFIFPATSQATISIRTRNFRVDDAFAEFGLGYRENYRSFNLGLWQNLTVTATGSGTLTFTAITTITLRWRVISNMMQMQWMLTGTVGGAGAEIRIALPAGVTAVGRARNPIQNFEAGANKFGVAEVQNGDAFVRIYKDVALSGNWTAGAGETHGDIDFLCSGI